MPSLSFFSPLFLLGAAAIAIPIALHLFFRRNEPLIEFSAMRYLRQAPVEQSHRRRLKELLLLALRVAALVLLAGAFARPYLSPGGSVPSMPATLALIDTSGSLSAPGQFERARTRAADVIRKAPATHAVGVMAFAQAADLVAPLSEDRAGALAAVARLEARAGATRYRTALRQAAEQFGDRPGRIVVVTDLQRNGWETADEGGVPDGIVVDVEDVGGPERNVAVRSLRADGSEAVAIVQSFSSQAVTGQVSFALDGRRIDTVSVSVPAGGTGEARASLGGAASGILSATVTDSEGYAADNVRYALLDPAETPSILAVTSSGNPAESLYLERALAVAEGNGGFRFRAVSGRAFSDVESGATGPEAAAPASSLRDVSVVVILSSRGLEPRGRERLAAFVRAGGGLLLTAGPDVDAALMEEALNGLVETSWRSREARSLSFAPSDSRHPIFRMFAGGGTLGQVRFARTVLVSVGAQADVLARYSDGSAAVVEERTGAGPVIVFASDLNNRWNDFPLQPVFVPFVHETLRYLTPRRAVPSEYLVGDLPGTQGTAPGVVVHDGRRVVVNVDPRESDPARLAADAFSAGISRLNATAALEARGDAREQEQGQRLWQYALLLMVVTLAAEGMLGRRLG